MLVLLDESLPAPLRRLLPGHTARTVPQMTWAGLKNGQLFARIEVFGRFGAFLTADQNVEYQQNLSLFSFALIVLIAPNNQLETLAPLIPRVVAALDAGVAPGQVIHIEAETNAQNDKDKEAHADGGPT